MSLWGANGIAEGFEEMTTDRTVQSYYTESPSLGMDLAIESRERMDSLPVPLPAALPLFAAGLALLGFAGWRRGRVITA